MSVNSISIIIGAAYLPPDSFLEVYSAHAELVRSLDADFNDHIFCVVGDYNLPNLVWYSMDDCDYITC